MHGPLLLDRGSSHSRKPTALRAAIEPAPKPAELSGQRIRIGTCGLLAIFVVRVLLPGALAVRPPGDREAQRLLIVLPGHLGVQ